MSELRRELRVPVVDEQLVGRLTVMGEEIVRVIEGRGEYRALLMRFQVEAGVDVTAADLLGASGSMREFVRGVVAGRPGRVADITREELLEIVRRVMEGEGSESEIQYWIELLQANLPKCRSVSNLIYWPWGFPEPKGVREATAEEVLEAAMEGRGTVHMRGAERIPEAPDRDPA